MRSYLFLTIFSGLFCMNVFSQEKKLQIGMEVLLENVAAFQGKNIAIVGNQTSILPENPKTHLVDALLEKKLKVVKIFAPEHGFRGEADAGATVVDGKDTKTGLPIISLYGNQKKPSKKNLEDVDVVIFDLQDVGVRFYTYISTLHYVMEACADHGVKLVVLDRPNPNGAIVDGPVLEPGYESFVGMHPVPVLHGMTIGEYAQMILGEKWLRDGKQCQLEVISCKNYRKSMPYSLPVRPSPNLPNDLSINLYASLCFFEGTNVSVGRGTEQQFQIFGSPHITKKSYSFTPKPNFGSSDPLHNGKECFGENLTQHPKINRLEIKWLKRAYTNTSPLIRRQFFNSFFPKLAGNNQLQFQIINGVPENEIRESWKSGLEQYEKMRKKYLMYDL